MTYFLDLNETEISVLLGSVNTAIILNESNTYNLEHKKKLEPHQKRALECLKIDHEQLSILHEKILRSLKP